MDMRSRLLALMAFGVFAGALIWAAIALQNAARRTEQDFANLGPTEQPRSGSMLREASADRSSYSSDARAEGWRSQLDRLTARVNRLSDLLDRKTSDYDALKEDYDHNAELLRILLEQTPAARKVDRVEAKPAGGSSDADTAETGKSEADTTDPAEKARAELRELRAELAAREKEAALGELQFVELEERERYLKSLATAALVKAGAAAVPSLTELLSDRRAEIRRWAATVLGEIGPDADAAMDALQEAQSDSNEEVRLAARKALRRIEAP